MKKKIAILGSTGSIGKKLVDIISKDKKNFEVVLLTTNQNTKTLLKQAKYLKAKNIIVTNKKQYLLIKNKIKKVNIFSDFNQLDKIFKSKVDYIMSAISGIDGLEPTFRSIKHTKKIAIANKEAIVCGWDLIKKNLNKYKTKFIPVDSEHFSIWYALQGIEKNLIEKIYLTASGGPFLENSYKKLNKVNIKQVTNHPNWKMGKKISTDSATMINKVFEVIEAKKIFNIKYNKISILIHPKSYVHAIIRFKNGLTKIVVHDTSMEIPIFNSLYSSKKTIYSNDLDFKILNNLDFREVNSKRFPLVEIIKTLPDKSSLFETILVSINDKFVELFLNNKIKFTDISKKMNKMLKLYSLKKYKKIKPKNIDEIIKMNTKIKKDIEKIIQK